VVRGLLFPVSVSNSLPQKCGKGVSQAAWRWLRRNLPLLVTAPRLAVDNSLNLDCRLTSRLAPMLLIGMLLIGNRACSHSSISGPSVTDSKVSQEVGGREPHARR
jgi:hypothetical protein